MPARSKASQQISSEEALLRVDGGGLPGAHPEEFGVELRRLVEESAVPGVRGARVVGVRVAQAVQVPAAVVGERADGVPLVRQQRPQLLGADLARVAAGHGDDRDRLVGGVDGGSGGDRSCVGRRPVGRPVGRAEQFWCAGRRPASAVLGWSKSSVAGSFRPAAAFSRLRSSTALSESKPSSLKARSGAIPSASAWPSTEATAPRDQFEERAPWSLGAGAPGVPERVPARPLVGAGGGGAPRGAHPGRGRARAACRPRPRPQPGVVEERRRAPARRSRGAASNRARPCSLPIGGDATAGQAGEVGVGQVTGHPAALGPQSQASDVPGRPRVPAVLREGVQAGVGRRVVGLSRGADRAGERGETGRTRPGPGRPSARAGAGRHRPWGAARCRAARR